MNMCEDVRFKQIAVLLETGKIAKRRLMIYENEITLTSKRFILF